MLLLRNEEISLEKWRALLTLSSFGSAFQTPAFYELCNEVRGTSGEVFAIEENGNLRGGF